MWCSIYISNPLRCQKRVRFVKMLVKAPLKLNRKEKKMHAVLYKRQTDALSGSQPLVLHSNAFKMSCFKWLEKFSFKSFSLNVCSSSCHDLTDISIIYRETVLDLRLIRMGLLESSATTQWHLSYNLLQCIENDYTELKHTIMIRVVCNWASW